MARQQTSCAAGSSRARLESALHAPHCTCRPTPEELFRWTLFFALLLLAYHSQA